MIKLTKDIKDLKVVENLQTFAQNFEGVDGAKSLSDLILTTYNLYRELEENEELAEDDKVSGIKRSEMLQYLTQILMDAAHQSLSLNYVMLAKLQSNDNRFLIEKHNTPEDLRVLRKDFIEYVDQNHADFLALQTILGAENIGDALDDNNKTT